MIRLRRILLLARIQTHFDCRFGCARTGVGRHCGTPVPLCCCARYARLLPHTAGVTQNRASLAVYLNVISLRFLIRLRTRRGALCAAADIHLPVIPLSTRFCLRHHLHTAHAVSWYSFFAAQQERAVAPFVYRGRLHAHLPTAFRQTFPAHRAQPHDYSHAADHALPPRLLHATSAHMPWRKRLLLRYIYSSLSATMSACFQARVNLTGRRRKKAGLYLWTPGGNSASGSS